MLAPPPLDTVPLSTDQKSIFSRPVGFAQEDSAMEAGFHPTSVHVQNPDWLHAVKARERRKPRIAGQEEGARTLCQEGIWGCEAVTARPPPPCPRV